MRSGCVSGIDYNNFVVKIEFDSIDDKQFRQTVFHPLPALVDKVNKGWSAYRGGNYDRTKFEVIDGKWDHDHCYMCYF